MDEPLHQSRDDRDASGINGSVYDQENVNKSSDEQNPYVPVDELYPNA